MFKGAFHLVKNSENSGSGLNEKRFFGSQKKWNCSKGSPVIPVETSQWKICVPFTDFSSVLFLSPVPDLSRSFNRPGVPRLPLPTGNSQSKFPKVFVNGKRPKYHRR